ncbi:uridine kinase [Rippkaea orientalis]|nr:uridine kinase [Rippkaea orientalis]
MTYFLAFNQVVSKIVEKYQELEYDYSLLVALSGIDGAGKGHLANQLSKSLNSLGMKTIIVHGDDWLNLPHIRFNAKNPAENFYRNGFRFEAMFKDLILPLKKQRFIQLEANILKETSTHYLPYFYDYEDIDIIILEAIYLIQPTFINDYDLAFWVDCSFKTALERALLRGQEGLSKQDTIEAYKTLYFAAQLIHFSQDNPKALASAIINNDFRLNNCRDYPQLFEIH